MKLLVLGLLVPLAGCGFDCDFPDYGTEQDFLSAGAAVAVSDTLVVRVETDGYVADDVRVFVPAGDVPIFEASDGETQVLARATVDDYEPVRSVELQATAAGDTLVVTLTREAIAALVLPPCRATSGPVQPVCSPAPSEIEVLIYGVIAPVGVVAVRVEYDDPWRGVQLADEVRPVRG